MRITSKGQVTIPIEVRRKAGLLPGIEVDFVVEDGVVRLQRIDAAEAASRGKRLVRRLRGTADYGMSTDELMKLLRPE